MNHNMKAQETIRLKFFDKDSGTQEKRMFVEFKIGEPRFYLWNGGTGYGYDTLAEVLIKVRESFPHLQIESIESVLTNSFPVNS